MPTYQNMSATTQRIDVTRDSGFSHTYIVDSMRFVFLASTDLAFIDSELLQLPIWRLVEDGAPPAPPEPPSSGLTTDDVPEGFINEYYSIGRARTDLLTNTIASGNVKAPTSDAIFDALANLPGGEAAANTFNYLLHSSVTEADIGKLMYVAPPESEGDVFKAKVYQEVVGLPAIMVMQIGAAGECPAGCIVHIYFYNSMADIDETFEVGVDFAASSDPATQYQNFKDAVLARTAITDRFTISDRESSFYMLLFTANDLGGASIYYENASWAYVSYDQYAQDPGPFNKALGKLKEISGDGYGVLYPYTGQSFAAVGAITKNAQIVGTDDGKVRARNIGLDDSRDCVIGLARGGTESGSVILNYCPRTPTIWLNNFEYRLPATPAEAMDMWIWSWWD